MSSGGGACYTNSQADSFQWKCISRVQEGGVWCTKLWPPLGGPVLLSEGFQHFCAGLKLAEPCSSLGATSSHCLLSSEPSQKSNQSPYLCPQFPPEPCLHPESNPFYLRHVTEFQNSKFQELPRCDCTVPPIPQGLTKLAGPSQESGCLTAQRSQFIAESQHHDLLLSAGFAAPMPGNKTALCVTHSSCNPEDPQTTLSLLGFTT